MAANLPKRIGRYEVVDVLAHGALGTVYLARDPVLEQTVALKVFPHRVFGDRTSQPFLREARTAAPLRHPNIVSLYDVGRVDDDTFVVMEYVSGEALSEVIRQQAPLPVDSKLEIMEQLAAGLAAAHRAGVVHGTLTPAKLMISSDGVAKILGFGLPRPASEFTATVGVPNYMAPEQLRGEAASARSDVFAAGAVFYEMLAYRQAFRGDTPTSVIHQVFSSEPELLDRVVPNLDSRIVNIISRCLAKPPEDRYPDMGGVHRDLRPILPQDAHERDRQPAQPVPPRRLPSANESESRPVRIAELISAARHALQCGDLAAALERSHQALSLDPANADARALHERAAASVESLRRAEFVEHRLHEARRRFEEGSYEAALELLRDSEPSDPRLDELRRELIERLQQTERQREERRRAQEEVRRNAYEEARRAEDERVQREQAEIERSAAAALESLRRAESVEYRLHEARRRFEEGSYEAALALLRDSEPSDPRLDELQRELIERLQQTERRREEERRRAQEAARRNVYEEARRAEYERVQREQAERSASAARMSTEEAHRRETERRQMEEEWPELSRPVAATTAGPRDGLPGETPTVSSAASESAWSTALGILAMPAILVLGGVKTALDALMRAAKGRSESNRAQPPLPSQPRPMHDPILLGVSAPRQAHPGTTFPARFAAYIKARETAVEDHLRRLDDAMRGNLQTIVGLPPARGGRWIIGAPITVRVSGEHLKVNPDVQSFEWNGSENVVSFLVSVDTTAPHGTTQLCFEAFIEGVPVAFIPLHVVIGSQAPEVDLVTTTVRPVSSAFASYASKDAPVVALLLSALKRWDPHAEVFMDCLDLTPNENWKHQLEQVIPSKDAFLLFWSTSASKSPWVAWELQHARSTKGLEWIRPMPIDDPETAPPPDFLQHLHFRDKYLIARQAFLRLRQQPPP